MSKTYYEEKAESLLAKRGEEEKPKPLIFALAAWLEEEHDSAYLSGVDSALRVLRDARLNLTRLEKMISEASIAGVACHFVSASGERCRLPFHHDGKHSSEGVV